MTIADLKLEISNVITSAGCSAEFFFLLDTTGAIGVRSVNIDEIDQDELSQMFIESIKSSILLIDDISLIELSSADDRSNVIYKYDLPAVPPELIQLKNIIENDNFENFSFANDDLKQLKGVLVLIGNQDLQLAIYKYQYPVTLLRKDSGFSLLKSRDENMFQKLDQDVLKISAKFEFMKINGSYYILDMKTLERFFGFQDAVKNIAEIGIANIRSANLVEDVAHLEDRLDEISFSRKLVKSANNSPVLGVIPNAAIISFAQTHPALQGKFRFSSDGTKLNLKTKKSQNLFLKLLNDDFLQSELTKRFYDSLAKDNIDDVIVEN